MQTPHLAPPWSLLTRCLSFIQQNSASRFKLCSLVLFRQVDILINNAGLALGVEPAHKSSLEDNITMLETNVTGLMAMTRAFAPEMVERKRGHILNMSSVAGVEGYVGQCLVNGLDDRHGPSILGSSETPER